MSENALQYKLENFEGPLDLLLYLISKHKLNICDINISELLDQYIESIKEIEEENMEDVSEFLEMATRLVYIKTAMLLPKYENEAEILKSELQGELIEYQTCKRIAEEFKKNFCGFSIFSRDPAPVSVDNTYSRVHPQNDIIKAYLSALGRKQRKLPPPVEAFSSVVHKKLVSVPSRAIIILKRLYRKTKLKWKDIFENNTREEKVATFLAVLELIKNKRISIDDDNSEISIGKNVGHNRNSKVGETNAT